MARGAERRVAPPSAMQAGTLGGGEPTPPSLTEMACTTDGGSPLSKKDSNGLDNPFQRGGARPDCSVLCFAACPTLRFSDAGVMLQGQVAKLAFCCAQFRELRYEGPGRYWTSASGEFLSRDRRGGRGRTSAEQATR